MPESLTIGDTPFQYETEATAGVWLSGDRAGERWFGTVVRWRPGTAGRWRKFTIADTHPYETDAVQAALRHAIVGGAS